mmetsp:Transcript_7954/g.33263  ORF Transcript_7954/g.33263 Transcript_7954/m.33263 type:complete len:425 (+) Transcript_7954:182-1456(+)
MVPPDARRDGRPRPARVPQRGRGGHGPVRALRAHGQRAARRRVGAGHHDVEVERSGRPIPEREARRGDASGLRGGRARPEREQRVAVRGLRRTQVAERPARPGRRHRRVARGGRPGRAQPPVGARGRRRGQPLSALRRAGVQRPAVRRLMGAARPGHGPDRAGRGRARGHPGRPERVVVVGDGVRRRGGIGVARKERSRGARRAASVDASALAGPGPQSPHGPFRDLRRKQGFGVRRPRRRRVAGEAARLLRRRARGGPRTREVAKAGTPRGIEPATVPPRVPHHDQSRRRAPAPRGVHGRDRARGRVVVRVRGGGQRRRDGARGGGGGETKNPGRSDALASARGVSVREPARCFAPRGPGGTERRGERRGRRREAAHVRPGGGGDGSARRGDGGGRRRRRPVVDAGRARVAGRRMRLGAFPFG